MQLTPELQKDLDEAFHFNLRAPACLIADRILAHAAVVPLPDICGCCAIMVPTSALSPEARYAAHVAISDGIVRRLINRN